MVFDAIVLLPFCVIMLVSSALVLIKRDFRTGDTHLDCYGVNIKARKVDLKLLKAIHSKNKCYNYSPVMPPKESVLPTFLEDYKYKIFQARWGINRRFHIEFLPCFIMIWIIWKMLIDYNLAERPYQILYLVFGSVFLLRLVIWNCLDTYEPDGTQDCDISKMNLVVAIPCYNEDVRSLCDCIISLLIQTRPPNEIHITDDGSAVDYSQAKEWFLNACSEYGVKGTWERQENAGKRQAHANSISRILDKKAAIVCTIDSDCTLDPHAFEEGMKPFAWSQNMSVTGLVLSKYVKANLLARVVDQVPLVVAQHLAKGGAGVAGNVMVNSGAISLYRSEVIEYAVDFGYTSEMYNGEFVHFSDDSYLTLIALSMGKTIFQPSCFSFADMPIKFNHHARQMIRWMRGATIRGLWRIKYFPIISWTIIYQALNWATFFCTTSLFLIWFHMGVTQNEIIFLLGMIIVYHQFFFLVYLSVQRSDFKWYDKVISYFLIPISALWLYTVMRVFNIYAMLTHRTTLVWGTREVVETVR